MRIVIDTGIFISALITKGTPPDMVYQAWDDGVFALVTSKAQMAELRRVLSYEKLRKYIKPEETAYLLEALQERTIYLSDIPDVSYSRDPDDDKIIATAIAGQADYIISGDKRDLLSLGSVANIRIISAREAVKSIFG